MVDVSSLRWDWAAESLAPQAMPFASRQTGTRRISPASPEGLEISRENLLLGAEP